MVALATFTASAQVGIGVPTANIDASAQLEVASTTKGFLAPRMTETQKNAITSPAAGLLVYQTDGTSGFYYYDGTTWKQGLGPQGETGAAGAAGVAGQTNTSLLYPSASIYADGAAPTNAPSAVTTTYGNFGWYFKKTGNSKINWYIQPKSSSMKVSDLTGLYLELFNVAITNASDMPYITVYTKATGSGDAASWYKSRRSYTFSGTPATNTKYLGFANLGATSPNSYNNNLLDLLADNILSRGDYANTEDILTIVINSSSVASTCEFVANKLGVITGSGTQEFLFMPPSSVADLSGYATTNALSTEVARAQAAETTLTSSVNDLSNNVIQNYATNTSVTDLANEVMQNYATNTFVNNLANEAMQNYATKTSVTDLANDVIQNYATNTAVNNLSNNLTGTIQQLEGQVAQSTSDISALGSSLNEKAPIASPSFTGTVTVGGASSTSSAVVEVSSTTQGLLVPRMTNDQVNAISNPAEGLILYNTTTGKFMGFAKSTTTSSAPTIQQPLMSINEFSFGYREMSMGPEVEIMKNMLGQTFTLPNASTLNSIQLYLTNFAGGASSNVTVSVYSGDLPQDYAAFDFSNPITSSSQTLSSTGYTTFNFTPLSLTAGKYYFILSCDNQNYACSGDSVVFTDTDSNGTSVNEYYFQTQYNGRQQYDYINYKSNSSYSLYFVLGLSGSTSETKNWKNLDN